MSTLAEWIDSPFSIPIGIVAAVMAAWVLVNATQQWRKVRVSAYNARLKQLMIERGMSANEIKTVLEAGSESKDSDDDE